MIRKLLSRCLALLAVALSIPAAADTTGFWFDPAQPGWGLNIAEQDGTAFAVLLVYDTNAAPSWYVASGLAAIGSDFSPFTGGPLGLSGTLYRTSGSWFGGPFDPAAFHAQQVGTLKLVFTDGNVQPESMHVTYSIDGRTVEKDVRRQTWASNVQRIFSASYEGGLYVAPGPTSGCPTLSLAPFGGRPFVFQVLQVATPSGVRMQWGTGVDTACSIDGTYEQRGQFGAVTGTLTCGVIGTTAPIGTIKLESLQVSDHGFVGAATFTQGSCVYTGHVGGVRQGQ
jgi:hypothetical protein